MSVATAEDIDSGATPIDMKTDDDGNGIPDEFETEYRKLMAALADIDASQTNLEDIQESKTSEVLRGFYERLPIKAQTKQALDQRALEFKKFAKADTSGQQQKVFDDVLKKEKELLEDDPVYAKVMKYIQAIALSKAEGDSVANADEVWEVKGVAGEDGVLPGQSLERPNLPDSISDEYLESQINRAGDIIFRNSHGQPGGSSYHLPYIRDWSHVGVYATGGFVYDADADGGGDCTDNANGAGVAYRPLERYYRNGYDVRYAQLANASWRSSEAGALDDAEDEYDTACETPFSLDVFNPQRTDTFHCSSLVWRIYLDNEDHSVNVDSKHPAYFEWLKAKYQFLGATFIITHAVAPDEIALDSDLNHYYEADIRVDE
jgi:hypothetical protein